MPSSFILYRAFRHPSTLFEKFLVFIARFCLKVGKTKHFDVQLSKEEFLNKRHVDIHVRQKFVFTIKNIRNHPINVST